MPSGYEYEIVGISGREESQKCAAKLAASAGKYNNKRISLNERFGIIDRGFFLHAVEFPDSIYEQPVKITVDVKKGLTKEEFVEKFKATEKLKNEKVSAEEVVDKENAPASSKSGKEKEKEKVTPESYFREIKNQLQPTSC